MILGIYAHPDDEIIFGWPIFQSGEKVHILNISDNANTYGPAPWRALQEVCEANGATCETAGLPNEFYRLPTRRSDFVLPTAIEQINVAIAAAIEKTGAKTVYTHNQWGEYGHGDHRLVYDIVIRHPDIEYIMTTDICQKNQCHLSTDEPPARIMHHLNTPARYNCALDPNWYQANKQLYERHGAWSWSGHDVVSHCNLYSI